MIFILIWRRDSDRQTTDGVGGTITSNESGDWNCAAAHQYISRFASNLQRLGERNRKDLEKISTCCPNLSILNIIHNTHTLRPPWWKSTSLPSLIICLAMQLLFTTEPRNNLMASLPTVQSFLFHSSVLYMLLLISMSSKVLRYISLLFSTNAMVVFV